MKKNIILILILLLLNIIKSKILFVFEHFRHGHRNPCNHIDKNGRDYLGIKWDFIGELTSIGKRQHFLLGLHNREKYKNFLLNYYHPKEILVISTNRNRTIESVTANLMGMFYNKGMKMNKYQIEKSIPQNININNNNEFIKNVIENLGDNFLPFNIAGVPIHLFKEEDHDFMLHEPKYCYPIKLIKHNLHKSKKMKELANKFKTEFGKELNKFLENNGNKENNKNKKFFNSFLNVYNFCDHFISDITYDINNDQIQKLKNEYKIDLNKLINHCQNLLKIEQFDVVFGKDDVLFMSMSPPFKKIINWMEKRINLNQLNRSDELQYESPKFVIYSGHDTTVAGFIKLMNKVFNSEIINPEYSANIYFELVFNENNNSYYVNYLNGDIILNTIEFKEFKEKIEKILWNENEIFKFCDFNYWNIYKILIHILICFVIFLIFLVIVYIKKNKNLNKILIKNNLINITSKEIKPIKLNEEENNEKNEKNE